MAWGFIREGVGDRLDMNFEDTGLVTVAATGVSNMSFS
jgi:hypothetical protein